MVQIAGDDHGYIELTPGQQWVVPGLTEYVAVTHAAYINSDTAFINIDVGSKHYGLPIKQRTWYDVGGIKFYGDVQIRNKRLNHINVIVPNSWLIQNNVSLTIENYDVWVIDAGNGSGLVKLALDIVGSGSKTLEINWGGLEISKSVRSAGSYSFARPMNSGTHQICVDLV